MLARKVSEAEIQERIDPAQLTLVSAAIEPSKPTQTRQVALYAVAGMIGLILGVIVALWSGLRDIKTISRRRPRWRSDRSPKQLAWRRFEGLTQTRRWLLLVFLVGCMHAGAYALLVPLWQAPDEPGHYEVACLLSQVKRPLTGDDLSLPLQRDILANLAQHEFWTQVHAPQPAPLPLAFADDPFLARSGRQAGDEPPLYYLIPALICRTGLSIEARLRLIRLFGALLFGLTGVVAVWGVRREGRQIGEHLETGGRRPATSNLPLLSPCLLLSFPPPAHPPPHARLYCRVGKQRRVGHAHGNGGFCGCAASSAAWLDLAPRRGADSAAVAGIGQQENQQLSAAVVDNSGLGAWLALAETSCLAAQGRGEDRFSAPCLSSSSCSCRSNTPASWRTIGLPWAARRLDATAPRPPGAPESPVVIEIDRSRRGVIQAITGQPARALRGQIVQANA